jgi:hypothetical protein
MTGAYSVSTSACERPPEPTVSYVCAEIRAYDELRKVVTIAFSDQWPLKPTSATYAEVSTKDCDAIGHDAEVDDTGLTSNEARVLKLLLEEGGALEELLGHPEHLVGRVWDIDE